MPRITKQILALPLCALLLLSLSATATAMGNRPAEEITTERSDRINEPDGDRRATGEGVGTSTGTVTDMGPDNNMRIEKSEGDEPPTVELESVDRPVDTRRAK